MHPQAFLSLNLENKWFNLNGKDYFCTGYEIKKNNSILVTTDTRKFVWKYLSEYENIKPVNKPIPKKYMILVMQRPPVKKVVVSKEEQREKHILDKNKRKQDEYIKELSYGICNVYRCKISGRFVSGIFHTSGSYEFGSFSAKTSAYRIYIHAKKIIEENYDNHFNIDWKLSDLRTQMLRPTEIRSEMIRTKPFGVDYMEKVHKWRVNIRIDGMPIHISLEDTEELGVITHARYVKENNLKLKSENSYISTENNED
jgi:hypothetical protein